jgi:hypothetical protein
MMNMEMIKFITLKILIIKIITSKHALRQETNWCFIQKCRSRVSLKELAHQWY